MSPGSDQLRSHYTNLARELRSRARRGTKPYRHWILDGCLSSGAVDAANDVPFAPPALGGVSGRREVHNATRKYFDVANRASLPIAGAMADALQSENRDARDREEVLARNWTGAIFASSMRRTSMVFWLEPHTDLGVKMFTFPALPFARSEPRRSWHRHLRRRQEIRRAIAVQAGRSDDLRSLECHVSRFRAAQDPGRSQVDHHQLRVGRVESARAACVP